MKSITLAVGQSTEVNGVQIKFVKHSSGTLDNSRPRTPSSASLFTTYEFELNDPKTNGRVYKEYVVDAYSGVATHTKFEYGGQKFEYAGFDNQSKKINMKVSLEE